MVGRRSQDSLVPPYDSSFSVVCIQLHAQFVQHTLIGCQRTIRQLAVAPHKSQMRRSKFQCHLRQLRPQRGQRGDDLHIRRQHKPRQGDRTQDVNTGKVLVGHAVRIGRLGNLGIPCDRIARCVELVASINERAAKLIPLAQRLGDLTRQLGPAVYMLDRQFGARPLQDGPLRPSFFPHRTCRSTPRNRASTARFAPTAGGLPG